MINDLEFTDDQYFKALAYTLSDGTGIAYLADFPRWQKIEKAYGEDFLLKTLISTLSHETMHKVIERLENEGASSGLDNLEMDEGVLWELASF